VRLDTENRFSEAIEYYRESVRLLRDVMGRVVAGGKKDEDASKDKGKDGKDKEKRKDDNDHNEKENEDDEKERKKREKRERARLEEREKLRGIVSFWFKDSGRNDKLIRALSMTPMLNESKC
jgi:hypothetical protein